MAIPRADVVPPTLGVWLRAAWDRLSHVASPRNDAERLAAHVIGISWGELWSRIDEPIDHATWAELETAVGRRADGEPLAYIIGSVVFHSLEVACGPGVLVPRPETETLVDVALELIAGIECPVVADIGCGTGAIALVIKHLRPDADVWATDISENALRYARRNARTLGLDIRVAAGDLFDALSDELRGRIDLVVANPPYVPDGAGLPDDVKAEPAVALFGGPTGEDILRRLVGEARTWLRPGGALAVEIGEAWQAAVLEGAVIRPDLAGRPRAIWARF